MNVASYFKNISEYKLIAQKEVGQNFLIDYSFAKRIVGLADLGPTDKVLEIGCGAGSLSFFIAETASEADLIDIDAAMVAKVASDFADVSTIHAMQSNIMRCDISSYDKMIGNLPYYITSGIIERCLLEGKKLRSAIFMVQKETADRFCAQPGSKDYSPLTMYLNYVCLVKKMFIVPRTAFAPAPHVDSRVLMLTFDQSRHNEEAAKMYQIAKVLFAHRRKTILNNLKSYLSDPEKAVSILRDLNVEANKRPEELPVGFYISLAQQLL